MGLVLIWQQECNAVYIISLFAFVSHQMSTVCRQQKAAAASKAAVKQLGKRNATLLSFDEEEEDGGQSSLAQVKIRSYHDTVEDPRLSFLNSDSFLPTLFSPPAFPSLPLFLFQRLLSGILPSWVVYGCPCYICSIVLHRIPFHSGVKVPGHAHPCNAVPCLEVCGCPHLGCLCQEMAVHLLHNRTQRLKTSPSRKLHSTAKLDQLLSTVWQLKCETDINELGLRFGFVKSSKHFIRRLAICLWETFGLEKTGLQT